MALWDGSGSVLQLEERAVKLSDFPAVAEILSADVSGGAGVAVNVHTANSLSYVWRAVALLSSQVAALPLILYRRRDDVAERAREHPLWRLLHDDPNDVQTQYVFRETMMRDALLWGNAVAEIERDGARRPIALHHIPAQDMTVSVEAGEVRYQQTGSPRSMGAADVLHVLGMSWDGIVGISVVTAARLSLGLGIALERFGGSFFANGTWPGVVLQHPGKLSDPAHDRLKESVESYLGSVNKAHKLLVTEEGIKVDKFTIPPNDAQFLESRGFQVEEVARWFTVPAHKLGHKAGERPGGNLEASQIEFLTDSLRPWLVRFEQEVTRKLISKAQRSSVFVEFLVDAILRADSKTRHTILLESSGNKGYRTVNEVRRLENLPELEGGDELPRAAAPPPPAADPEDDEAARTARREFAESMAQIRVKRDAKAARGAAKRGSEAFGAWVERYVEKEADVLARFLLPLARARVAELGTGSLPSDVARTVAGLYLDVFRKALLDLPARTLEESAERFGADWEAAQPCLLVDAVDTAAEGANHA